MKTLKNYKQQGEKVAEKQKKLQDQVMHQQKDKPEKTSKQRNNYNFYFTAL